MLQVSFYSYKGGAGRSTTSWNTIQRLVNLMKPSVKNPFVIVDTDTESAGSTFLYKARDIFFNNTGKKKISIQRRIKNGENDYMDASPDVKKEFFNGMHPIGTYFGLPEEEEKAVLLIGADLDKNSRMDMRDLAKDKDGRMLENFPKIRESCKDCDAMALFFDTPSGTQDLARLSIQESDIIVCCMRPTYQFREGTKGQLINFVKDDLNLKIKRKYILTPTTICVDKEQLVKYRGEQRDYPQQANDDIKMAFDTERLEEGDNLKQAFRENVLLDMLEPTPVNIKKFSVSEDDDSVFGIPEIKRFKWFEECLGRLSEGDLNNNDKMGLNRYEYLAQTICKYGKV
ncbi:MAG: hypothetical protein FWC26_07640 [Fibromonadales bacterium]|nr:hypothetical protein [Fibromonadales bacterium]